MNQLKKAERKRAKLRIGISGSSGSGKTYSALLLARGFTDWNKIALIDTESGSGELYAHLGEYNVITLSAPFSPEKYIEAIETCQKANMEVIIIDSATHEWEGKGGCLEIQERLGGRYQDWAKVTPRHRSFVDAILQSNSHMIVTLRRKQDYQMSKSQDGRMKVEKMGMKEIQREGFEYDLTLNFELDIRHNTTASKDRTGLFMDKPEFCITEETGKKIKEWNEGGSVEETPKDEQKPQTPNPSGQLSPEEQETKKRVQIVAMLAKLGVGASTKADYEFVVKSRTDLKLKPENYNSIIAKLDILIKEKKT